MKFEIPFMKFTGKASLEVEISDDIEIRYRLRAAVVVAAGDGADLRGADLRGADLRGADGIPPIPKINDLDGVILKSIEAGGTLDMSGWHGNNNEWCGTTHCRAGWAIHEAGKEGKALQDAVGIPAAAALIYAKSYPDLLVPDFYCNNQEALADIKSRAKAAMEAK